MKAPISIFLFLLLLVIGITLSAFHQPSEDCNPTATTPIQTNTVPNIAAAPLPEPQPINPSPEAPLQLEQPAPTNHVAAQTPEPVQPEETVVPLAAEILSDTIYGSNDEAYLLSEAIVALGNRAVGTLEQEMAVADTVATVF